MHDQKIKNKDAVQSDVSQIKEAIEKDLILWGKVFDSLRNDQKKNSLLIRIFCKEVSGMGKNQHVVKTDNGWGIRGEGNSRLTSEHKTQQKAINAAIPIAKNQKSEVVIHGTDGKIRDKDSYGPDNCLPKDKKH